MVSIKLPNGKELRLKNLTLEAVEAIETAISDGNDAEVRLTKYGCTVASVRKKVTYRLGDFIETQDQKRG